MEIPLTKILNLYKISKELKIDPEKGIIKSKRGIRYLLFSSDMALAIEDELKRIIGKDMAKGMTYRIGYEAGKRFATPFKEEFKDKTTVEIANKCGEFAQIAGWGRHEIGIVSDEKIVITVYNSPISGLKKTLKEFSCHFHAGLLGGSADVITEKRIRCEEVKCVARGDKFCQFILNLKPNKESILNYSEVNANSV